MRKKIPAILATALLLIVCAVSVCYADAFDNVLQRWTKSRKFIDSDSMVGNMEVKATYYSAEFIEAYVQSQAQKNMWTAQETEDYKVNFLKALRLDEMIPFQIEFNNNFQTMYLGPFDIMAKLYIGNKQYKMVDYDKRFNFKFQGKKEGLVYFRRYDEKTGKDLLKGVKSVKLVFSPNISPITDGSETTFMWDVANDNPSKLYQGKTADRFETDRLLKRLEAIRKDKADIQKKLDAISSEEATIQKRLDELAKK